MDQCVADWDFDGAKAFREPLIFSRKKLNVLKGLENPNYAKIRQLTFLISRMEKSIEEKKSEIDNLDEQTRPKFSAYFIETRKKRINQSRKELEELAIVYFEVFGVFGNEGNVKIK